MFINIGLGNLISEDKIIAVLKPESAPIKRMVQEAKENKNLVDSTFGRKTRAVIVCMENKIILSSIQPETIANRHLNFTKENLNER